jgi:hypothetical protein
MARLDEATSNELFEVFERWNALLEPREQSNLEGPL